MSRITGSEVASLMEAYSAVYAPQELTEEQIWEEVENWVNSLLEEGYDLSEYTWEEMYENYIQELTNPINDLWSNRGRIASAAKGAYSGTMRGANAAVSQLGTSATNTAKAVRSAVTSPRTAAAVGGFGSGGLVGAISGALGAKGSNPKSQQSQSGSERQGPPVPDRLNRQPLDPGRFDREKARLRNVGNPTGDNKPPTGDNKPPTAPAAPAATRPAAPKVAPTKPAAPAQTGDKAKDMATWASTPANKGLAAAAAERARTRGTSSTTNPLMQDMKSRLPAAAAKVSPTPAPVRSGFGVSSAPIAAKASVSNVTAPEVKASNKLAAAPKLPSVAPTRAPIRQMQTQSYEYDAYDVVLEYLLSQGHAETVEEAHYVMMEMDAETIGSIVEAGENIGPEPKTVGGRERPGVPDETYEQRRKRLLPSSQVKDA
jgi:hypothetical protein